MTNNDYDPKESLLADLTAALMVGVVIVYWIVCLYFTVGHILSPLPIPPKPFFASIESFMLGLVITLVASILALYRVAVNYSKCSSPEIDFLYRMAMVFFKRVALKD